MIVGITRSRTQQPLKMACVRILISEMLSDDRGSKTLTNDDTLECETQYYIYLDQI